MARLTKVCSKCKEVKSIKAFYKRGDGKGKDGYESGCKKCRNKKDYEDRKIINPVYHKKWRNTPNGKRCNKNYALKRLCGATIDSYDELLAEQNNCCAICGIHQSEFDRALHQDHNHLTGQIRGILCVRCNSAIGNLRADEGTQLLQEAVKYVEKYK